MGDPLVRPRITAIAIVPGERELGLDELAAMHGASTATIERLLGGRSVCVSGRTPLDLGVDAAKLCLAKARVDAKQLGAVLWTGFVPPAVTRPSMYIQHAVGATQANPVQLVFNCTELLSGLQVARAMIRDEPALDRVLLVGGVSYGEAFPKRTRVPIKEKSNETLFSDCGVALLVERRGPGAELSSFGNGSVGLLWDYLERMAAPPVHDDPRGPLPTMLQALLYSKPAHDRALSMALRDAGVAASDLDHVLFPREPGGLERQMMRQMQLDPGKLCDPPGGPTHTGVSDPFIGLEHLMGGAARSGAHILVASRTIGLMRCAVVRIVE